MLFGVFLHELGGSVGRVTDTLGEGENMIELSECAFCTMIQRNISQIIPHNNKTFVACFIDVSRTLRMEWILFSPGSFQLSKSYEGQQTIKLMISAAKTLGEVERRARANCRNKYRLRIIYWLEGVRRKAIRHILTQEMWAFYLGYHSLYDAMCRLSLGFKWRKKTSFHFTGKIYCLAFLCLRFCFHNVCSPHFLCVHWVERTGQMFLAKGVRKTSPASLCYVHQWPFKKHSDVHATLLITQRKAEDKCKLTIQSYCTRGTRQRDSCCLRARKDFVLLRNELMDVIWFLWFYLDCIMDDSWEIELIVSSNNLCKHGNAWESELDRGLSCRTRLSRLTRNHR